MLKLYNNDCRNVLSKILKTTSNPVIVSDPPFNIGYGYRTYKDKMKENEYLEFMGQIFGEVPAVVIHYPESLYKIAFQIKKTPQKVVSWVYNSNTQKQHRDIAFFDIAPDFKRVRQPYKNPKDKRIQKLIEKGCTGAKLYDWWNINQVKNISKEKQDHPCQMPLEVMKNIIGILPDDVTIIDPFMGTGTTGMACMELGRSFIGIEIDTHYFDIATNRLFQFEKKEEESRWM